MTRDNIISELFRSKEFNDCIRKMEPRHLQDDLKSEVMLILCEKAPFVIEELHSKGELKYYAVRIILNMIKSNTSSFYKKFRGANGISDVGLREKKILNMGDGRMVFVSDGVPECYEGEEERTIHIADRLTEEKKNELRMMEVFNLMPSYNYDMKLFLEYLELGTYREISKRIGIPHVSAHDTIKKASKRIEQAVNERMARKRPYEPGELLEYITRSDRQQAIDHLNNVLEYFSKEYNEPVMNEIYRRITEREKRFMDQELKPNVA